MKNDGVVRTKGFEPPARSLGNCCSIHLSYERIVPGVARMRLVYFSEFHCLLYRRPDGLSSILRSLVIN